MSSQALRRALAALFVAVLIGAAYVVWTEASQGRAAAAAVKVFEDHARAVARSLLEIKTAQAGYVAAGQGDDFWAARVDELLGPARETLKALRTQAQLPQSQAEVDAAIASFEDFEQLDRRARDYARGGQRLLASDLVFSEGLENVDGAIAALDRARDLEAGARDAHSTQGWIKSLAAAATVVALALVVLVLLTPVPRQSQAVPAQPAEPAEKDPAGDYPLGRPAARSRPASIVEAREAVVTPVAPAPPPPSPGPVAPRVDLPGIASLCSDLARVPDTRALPAALERATRLLDAAGIVVWVADPDGRELAPVLAHGYPQNLVNRLGVIPRDAENVTAAAFRTGLVQTVRSDSASPGAIAAPLLTPAGPVGVMAAEILHDGERDEGMRAAATILAAQFATLMGPPSSRMPGKAEVAG
jgi:hypothetical protein